MRTVTEINQERSHPLPIMLIVSKVVTVSARIYHTARSARLVP